jgi:hypothetical protein
MRKSTIYLFVALSLLCLGLTLIPNVHSQTNETQNIKILNNYTHYIDYSGILDVVGEVQNVGPTTVDPVFLIGRIYSSTGADISDSYCEVWQRYLMPQQKAPFYMEFQPPSSTGIWHPSDFSNVTLIPYIANATTGYQYPDLSVISSSGTVGTGGNFTGAYLVNGVIKNTGSQTAVNLTVAATFYNATGSVVAVGNTYDPTNPWITPSLAPSETVSFQVAAFDLNQSVIPSWEKVFRYSLIVQATGPILQGTPPVVTPYPDSGTSGTSSSTSTSPPSTHSTVNSNNSSNTGVILAVIIAVVIIVLAGTVVALIKRKPHQTVKEARKARKRRR